MQNVGFTSILLACMLLMLAPGAQSIMPSCYGEQSVNASHGSTFCFDLNAQQCYHMSMAQDPKAGVH